MVIYKATNKINSKSYIGQTTNTLDHRKSQHTYCKNTYFSMSLKKHGKNNFIWEVIEECNSKEELDEMEFHYIKQYNTKRPNGYNLTDGGDKGTCGWIPSEKTKEKISNSLRNKWLYDKEFRIKMKPHIDYLTWINKNNNPMKGKKRPEIVGDKNPAKRKDVRDKISKNNKSGTKKVKDKISKANKGKRLNKTYEEIFGYEKSIIIKEKQSISKKGKCGVYKRSKEEIEKHRKNKIKFKYEFNSPEGKIIISTSLRQFAKIYNLNRSSLTNLVNGKIKSGIYKGWKGRII